MAEIFVPTGTGPKFAWMKYFVTAPMSIIIIFYTFFPILQLILDQSEPKSSMYTNMIIEQTVQVSEIVD